MFGRVAALALVFMLCAGHAFAQVAPPITPPCAGLPARTGPAPAAETPERVQIGIYVNDIQQIDLAHHRFSADFYVWFRWRGADLNPVCTFEFMNDVDPDQLRRAPVYDVALTQPDGALYQLARIQGVFSTKFALERYPFDRQTLHIDIEDSDKGADELVYVVDSVAVNPEITLPGYRLGAVTLTARDKAYTTAFGDRQESNVGAYSRVTLRVPVARPLLSGAVKNFLPLALIILCASSALLLAARHIDAQIGLTITALLTLVAQQLAMSNNLPEVGYLLMLDQTYIASYAYILLLIGIVVIRSRLTDGEGGGTRRFHGPAVLSIALLVYAAAVAAIFGFNLSGAA